MKNKLLLFLGIFIFMIIPKNVFAYAPVLEDYNITLQGIGITSYRQNIWIPSGGTTGTLKLSLGYVVPDLSDIQKYGYIALCRTPASSGRLNYYDSYLFENVQMISTDSTCNNFNVNTTGQVVYFIFTMGLNKPWDCSVQGDNCVLLSQNAISFTEYQGATYSLYGYGFSNERFEYNNNSGALSTLGIGIQNVNGSISITNSKLDALATILNNNQTATNSSLNNIENADIDASDKQAADTSSYSDYQTAENNLFGKMDNADINDMNIAIDYDSSNWVWGRITDFLNSHSLLMSFLISMLSIGIIKMALGR